MARKLGFKKTLRQQRLASYSAQSFYAAMLPLDDPRRAENMRRLAEERAAIGTPRKRAAPVQREAPVVAAIKQLLASHPRVLIALRMNAGSASYEAKSGKWAPVKFHEWLRYPEKMRMPDFIGFTIGGRPMAIEAKAPGWRKPTDDREREQEAYLGYIRERCNGIALFATSAQDVADALK